MLLRVIVENFSSFKDAVEFNTFPSSKSQSHENHKVICNHAKVLRLSAIYGANGAGKSNLLGAIAFLKSLVEVGRIQSLSIDTPLVFKFSEACGSQPTGLAIEFYVNGNIYYYHIEFTETAIVCEELFLSKKTKDEPIFKREKGNIKINGTFFQKGVSDTFLDALNRLVKNDMLLLTFLGRYYQEESTFITDAYSWFTNNLNVVLPQSIKNALPHLMDTNPAFAEMVNTTLSKLNIGLKTLVAKKEVVDEDELSSSLQSLAKKAKANQGMAVPYSSKQGKTEEVFVFENGILYHKWIVAHHMSADGGIVEMPIESESDGTRRLIEYMPLFYAITQSNKTYIVDEIERSMHPILIKNLVSVLSESKTAQGQLIFTTHESSLLDQEIFRPDEIWFAQKDVEQATQLYPLSDYNIHKTANIENGYLIGRYGGIPFLSNLNDLHW